MPCNGLKASQVLCSYTREMWCPRHGEQLLGPLTFWGFLGAIFAILGSYYAGCSAPNIPQRGSSFSLGITSPFVWGGRQRPGSHSHQEGRFPGLRSSASSLQQQNTRTPRSRSPLIPGDEGRRELHSSVHELHQPCSCCSSTAPSLPSYNTFIHNTPPPCCYGDSMEPLSISILAESWDL